MNNRQYGILLVAAALFALTNRPALANACDQPSPLQDQLGEPYWHVSDHQKKTNTLLDTGVTFSENQMRETRALFDMLELFESYRYDSGTGHRFVCKGAPHERRTVVFESEIERGDFSEKASGLKQIRFFEEANNDEERIPHYHDRILIELPTIDQWRIVSESAISNTLIHRANGHNGAKFLRQIDTELSKTEDGFQLTQMFYINGYRETWATWTLKK